MEKLEATNYDRVALLDDRPASARSEEPPVDVVVRPAHSEARLEARLEARMVVVQDAVVHLRVAAPEAEVLEVFEDAVAIRQWRMLRLRRRS